MRHTIEECSCFGTTYTKIGTIQRRLAWPLRKDDTQIREAFLIFLSFCQNHELFALKSLLFDYVLFANFSEQIIFLTLFELANGSPEAAESIYVEN